MFVYQVFMLVMAYPSTVLFLLWKEGCKGRIR